MYACVKFIYICKLFTSVYAFVSNIRCIGINVLSVCTCISYIYIYIYIYISGGHRYNFLI